MRRLPGSDQSSQPPMENMLDTERFWVGARILAGVLAAASGLVAVLGFFGMATVDDVPALSPGMAIAILASVAAVSLAANVWLLRTGGQPRRDSRSSDVDQSGELDQVATWMRQAMTFLEQMCAGSGRRRGGGSPGRAVRVSTQRRDGAAIGAQMEGNLG